MTNQPHNATAVAETDVDVWTLAKSDFDMLMGLYPGLALSMSRILTQRLTQMELGSGRTAILAAGICGAGPCYGGCDSRSRRNGPYMWVRCRIPVGGRPGFVQWFTALSAFGKVRLAFFVLLLVWLIGIAAPKALMAMLQGSTSVASGAELGRSSLFNAVNAVYAVGSYELAAKDSGLAEVLAMADQAGAADGDADRTADGNANPDQHAAAYGDAAADEYAAAYGDGGPLVAAVVAEEPTPEPVVQAASVAPRVWDPRSGSAGRACGRCACCTGSAILAGGRGALGR